jgi:hypothetical protein
MNSMSTYMVRLSPVRVFLSITFLVPNSSNFPHLGLHPEEAVEYLETILLQHEKGSRRVIYAITGTGHHSKNGKDKVGKGVRGWLNEGGWSFREFSVPGERGGYVGGVLGIDCSGRRSVSREEDGGMSLGAAGVPAPVGAGGLVIGEGKVRVLKREEVVGS